MRLSHHTLKVLAQEGSWDAQIALQSLQLNPLPISVEVFYQGDENIFVLHAPNRYPTPAMGMLAAPQPLPVGGQNETP
jgi:hypothetical protein